MQDLDLLQCRVRYGSVRPVTDSFDLIVGADGSRSQVRASMQACTAFNSV